MQPVYLVGKILAILGAVYSLWQGNFDLSTPSAKAALALGLSALGSLFENNATVNKVLQVITGIFGITYTPDASPAAQASQPPSTPKV